MPNTTTLAPLLTVVEAKKLKVADLKQELTSRGLDATGKKEELLARLIPVLEQPRPTSPTRTTNTSSPAKSGSAARSGSPIPSSSSNTSAAAGTSPQLPPSNLSPIKTALSSSQSAPASAASTTLTAHFSPPSYSTANAPLSAGASMGEDERRKARAARFGIPVAVPASSVTKATTSSAVPSATSAIKPTPTLPVLAWAPNAASKAAPLVTAPVVNHPAPLPLAIDPEILKRRQERFGVVNPNLSVIIAASEEEERKKRRAERFAGMATDIQSSGTTTTPAAPPSPKKAKLA